MKINFKISINQIKIFLLIFSIFTLFFFKADYSVDSLRYVFAGKQFFENFLIINSELTVKQEIYESKIFHQNIDYSYPKREFFTILPNIIFYISSIIFEDSLSYLIRILNLFLFSCTFIYTYKKYNYENEYKNLILIFFCYFGHYQVTGWNVKILPEILFFTICIFFFTSISNLKEINLKKIFILLILSAAGFFTKPQGLILLIVFLLVLIFYNFLKKNLISIFILMFFLYCLFLPVLLYLEIKNILNIPIISIDNTALVHGDIISGWLNYFNGDLIHQNVRFDNKKLDLTQSYNFFDLLKITLLRLFYFVVPYRFYESWLINLWSLTYFAILYYGMANFFLKTKNIVNKNIYMLIFIGILSFHMLVPSTGTLRYQLSLISLLFIINFEYLNLKKNYEKQNKSTKI
jgi:hypothetical protein